MKKVESIQYPPYFDNSAILTISEKCPIENILFLNFFIICDGNFKYLLILDLSNKNTGCLALFNKTDCMHAFIMSGAVCMP